MTLGAWLEGDVTPTVLLLGLCVGLAVAGLFFLANLLVDQFIAWTDRLIAQWSQP